MPYLTQQTFTCSKSTIETLEKGEICGKVAIKTPERRQLRFLAFLSLNFRLSRTFL